MLPCSAQTLSSALTKSTILTLRPFLEMFENCKVKGKNTDAKTVNPGSALPRSVTNYVTPVPQVPSLQSRMMIIEALISRSALWVVKGVTMQETGTELGS